VCQDTILRVPVESPASVDFNPEPLRTRNEDGHENSCDHQGRPVRKTKARTHTERGYRIEDERPIPVNGFCSFVAVRELPSSDGLSELVAQALNGSYDTQGDW
jgi:hypothetical protein